MQKLIVILGPTASGKSDIAVQIAKKFNGEIVSADSRQVYKDLNIGTGKMTKKEMRGVKHHLLDVCSPKKRFTASDFKKLTEKTIEEITKKSKIPVICGGTGFYIDALLGDKQIPEVPPNLKLRKELENKTTEELFEILKKLDSERAKNIDSKNPRRLVRAIEICKALGPNSASRFTQATLGKKMPYYDVLKIGIKTEEKELKVRINKRIEKWFKQGLLREVKELHKKGLSWNRMGEIGLEYKLVSIFLQNKISKSEMIDRMQTETWRYAKRQMTWFKKTKDVVWLTPGKAEGLEKEVRKFLKN
jgi:tRNA dimethylallyltransferase